MGLFDDVLPQEEVAPAGGLFADVLGSSPTKSSAVRRGIADPAISLLKGAIAVPEAAVGIADIPTLGIAGRAAEGIGFRPKEAKAELDTWYSPEQQAANRTVQEAKGFVPTLQAAVQNPSVIGHTVAESVPAMLGGAAVARGLLGAGAGALSRSVGSTAAPIIAGAAGEGIVGAGLSAEQIRQETPDGTLSPAQAGSALASGVGTGLIGAAGGAVARKLGLSDVDTMLAGGVGIAGTRKLPARVLGGAVSEGVLEEMPQSAQEQAWQNVALGKPAMEGVPEQAALGGLAGAAMGGVGGIVPAHKPAPGPLQKALDATPGGPTTATTDAAPAEAMTPVGADASVRDLVQAADAEDATQKVPAGVGARQPPSGGTIAPPAPTAPATSAPSDESQAADAEPPPPNTPAAPELVSAPVSTADTSPQTSQAEPAGVPTSTTEGVSSNASPTQEAVSPAPGRKEEPAAVSGAAGVAPATGGISSEAEHEKDAAALAMHAAKLRDLASRAIGHKRAGLTALANRMEAARDAIAARAGANLQNRDRSRAASVMQMTEIARNPDYMRLGPSRTPDSGAPMVFAVGDDHARIPAENFGNQDVAVMSDGQRVPFRYAVVDASQVEPSNFADGRVNPAFSAVANGTIKALNNGRTAGLRASYELGTAGAYQAELTNDVANVGISPDAVRRVANPILVRVYSESENTNGMAAKSQAQGLGMSPGELAKQDAPLFDSSILSLFRPGDVASADNRDFVRAFVGKLQQSGQDVAGMMTDTGTLSPTGRSRIQAALMQAAYGDADLVAEMFDSIDTDIKAIGEALKAVAGEWANMRDSARIGAIDPDVDITPNVIQALNLIRKARRDKSSLADLVRQPDLMTGETPEELTTGALRLFYSGRHFNRAVGRDKLLAELRAYVQGAMATQAGADMFGDKVTAADIIRSVIEKGEVSAESQTEEGGGGADGGSSARDGSGQVRPGRSRQREDGSRQEPAASRDAERKGQDAGVPGGREEGVRSDRQGDSGGLELTGQTPNEIAAAEAEAKARAAQEAKAQQEADKARKEAEDRTEIKRRSEAAAGTFELGGDAMANLTGQVDLFAAPPVATKQTASPDSPQQPAPAANQESAPAPSDKEKAAQDLKDALSDLADIFSKPFRANIVPEQEQKLFPVMVRVFDAAFRLGYHSFKDAARFVLQTIREKISPEVADALTIDHLQGAYIAMSGGREGASSKRDVIGVESKQEIEDAQRSGGDSERDRQAADAQRSGEDAVPDGRRAEGGQPGRPVPQTGGQRSGHDGGARLPDGGTAVAGERGDQPAHRQDGQIGPAVPAAGGDESGRSAGPGGAGVDARSSPAPAVEAVVERAAGRFTDKLEAQRAAEPIRVVVGDKANIDATLPFLTEGQREDVQFAEKRWSSPDGYGVLFTNGTGTGKTFLSLGAIKRLTKQGKGNGIVVVPNEAVMSEWVKSAPALGLKITPLADTKDAGSGIAITTYANFGQNDDIAKRDYDFVAIDEAHLLMLGKEAASTEALQALRAVSLHPDGVLRRAEMQNRELVERIASNQQRIRGLLKSIANPDTMDQIVFATRREIEALDKTLDADMQRWREIQDRVKADVLSRQGEKRPRVMFLSATPFAYEQNIQWGEGFLYEFPKVEGRGYNAPDAYGAFMIQHFGWRMRTGRLTQPDDAVDRDLMQRQFNSWLRKQGVLSARMLDVDHDYERKFILLEGGIGQKIDEGLKWLRDAENGRYWQLYDAINDRFDYLTRSRLLEAIKARAAIPYIRKHHAMGRKVVVFYDFNTGGGINVFNVDRDLASAEASERRQEFNLERDGLQVPVRGQPQAHIGSSSEVRFERVTFAQLLREFVAARPDLQNIDFSQYASPLATLTHAFPDAGVYNGMPQYKKSRLQAIRDFNDDAKPQANLLLVQKAANAGWSGHDTTGTHMRVLINLGLPTAPIEAIQQEGRIYRVGQRSDANFHYFNTGTNWERYAFGSRIARRAGTAENLAMGEQARGLREAFIQAFENSDPGYEPSAADGKGGKTGDRALVTAITDWDRAKALYFAQQKKTSRTKSAEGEDYFATPEPLGLKMVEWGGVLPGERVLEPSAGHGAIARWFPDKNDRTVIEPSLELASRLTLATDAKLVNGAFETHDLVNKYDVIVMNPPFGVGGKTAIEHLDKAFRHLADGGRVVALIPEGPTANKRFDDWMYGEKTVKAKPVGARVGQFGEVFAGDTATVELGGPGIAGGVTISGKVTDLRDGKLWVRAEGAAYSTGHPLDRIKAIQPTGERTAKVQSAPNAYLRASIGLPTATFERAGTGVKTRVVIIDKILDPARAAEAHGSTSREIGAGSVKELFDALENLEVVGRALPAEKLARNQQAQMRESARKATAGETNETGRVQPDGSDATVEEMQDAQGPTDTPKLLTDAPRVSHVTRAGKTIHGVIAKTLTKNQAKAIDPFTWSKDGGFFIRQAYVVRPPSVAEQERSVYAVKEPDGITGDLFQGTTRDLFAGTENALPEAAGKPLHGQRAATRRGVRAASGPASRVLAVRQSPDEPGVYHVSTQLVTVGERALPVGRINPVRGRGVVDAAKAFAHLSRHAVEHYDAIVTDKDGRPLAVVGSFKGALTQTSVYPSTVVAELSRIDGAAHLWAAHNHPSGMAELSHADRSLSDQFARVLDGSGVEYHGLFAMANKAGSPGDVAYHHTDYDHGEVAGGLPTPYRIPIVDRELTDERGRETAISSPAMAVSVVAKIAGRTPGIVFLDAQHRPVAFVPFAGEELGRLKVDGRLMRLFRSVSQANADGAIIAMPDGKVTKLQVGNVLTALSGIDVRVLDGIEYASDGSGKGRSLASDGELAGAGTVFSRSLGLDSITPADSAIYSMAQEGKTAAEILSFIGRASRQPFNRYLANALRNLGVASTITLDSQGGFAFGNRSYAQTYAAAYNPRTDTVALFTPREAERHILHELVHAATLKAIARSGVSAMRMRKLFLHVQRSGRLDGQYGMSNLDEFVAEAFSNPTFQEALRNVPAPADSTLKNAWHWFVRLVSRVLGLRTAGQETALDRALTVGAQLMRENAALEGKLVWSGRSLHLSSMGSGDMAGTAMTATPGQSKSPSARTDQLRDAETSPKQPLDTLADQNSAASVADGKGTLNHENPDIRFNVAGTQPAVTPPVSPGNAWQRAKAKAAEILSPKNLDKVIYELQDKYIDLRRLRDHIRAIGGTITDLNDAYLGEELYHKRLAHRTQDFLKAELRPLLGDMRARGVGIKDLETFLHARHAPEANAEMAKRNPNQAEIDAGRGRAAAIVHRLEQRLQHAQARGLATAALDRALNDTRGELLKWNGAQAFRGTEEERLSLSGLSDAAAAAIMNGLAPERRADLDALATRVDAINEGTLQLLQDYGLMSRESLDAWRRTYRYYIPLHRDEAHPDSANHPVGHGFSVKGDAAKRRTGSNQQVTHILGHIAMQREAALTRGEKNHVMLKVYLMARQNPLPDVWKVGAVPMTDTIDKATGFVKSVPDPLYRNRPNVLTLRLAGKDVAIVMNEHNPQALRMAQALKNLDVDDLHYLIPIVGKATRYFASINTQYNPIFGVINLMRDAQEAALNLSTTALAGKQGQVMGDALGILKEVVRNKGRMPTAGRWGRLFEEFNAIGGTTGYRDLYLNAEDRAKALLSELQALDRGKASQAAHAVASWLSDYNEAMENSVRLAAYKAALDNGMSRERAASLAKNLTVNFNRKGRQTRELGALYAFFNAAVQGTTRMAQTLAGPAGRKIMAGGVLLGAVNAMLGIAAMGGDDDDEWKKIPEFVKERSIIIPIGRQDYVSLPMPLGFQFLPNIGRLAVEMAVYKDKTLGKQVASLFTVLADAFNPLGGSSPALQIAAPTVLDPFVALAQNKDWTGRPIYIENFNALDPEPGFKRSKDSATPWAKGFAEAINAVTGGTEYTPGGWSPTPDQIDYVIGQLTGGLGREAGKVAATAAAPFTGEELPPYKIPLVGRLYGNTGGASGQSERFYERIREANATENEIKGRVRDGIGVADYLTEHPGAIELAARGNVAERQVASLRKARHDVVTKGGADEVAKVRAINEQMAGVMRNFNKDVDGIGRRAEQ